jgi:hypothetical protein
VSKIPGTTRSENEVKRADLLQQFREFFGVDVDGLITEVWDLAFQAGASAEGKRRDYIADVLFELRAARGET